MREKPKIPEGQNDLNTCTAQHTSTSSLVSPGFAALCKQLNIALLLSSSPEISYSPSQLPLVRKPPMSLSEKNVTTTFMTRPEVKGDKLVIINAINSRFFEEENKHYVENFLSRISLPNGKLKIAVLVENNQQQQAIQAFINKEVAFFISSSSSKEAESKASRILSSYNISLSDDIIYYFRNHIIAIQQAIEHFNIANFENVLVVDTNKNWGDKNKYINHFSNFCSITNKLSGFEGKKHTRMINSAASFIKCFFSGLPSQYTQIASALQQLPHPNRATKQFFPIDLTNDPYTEAEASETTTTTPTQPEEKVEENSVAVGNTQPNLGASETADSLILLSGATIVPILPSLDTLLRTVGLPPLSKMPSPSTLPPISSTPLPPYGNGSHHSMLPPLSSLQLLPYKSRSHYSMYTPIAIAPLRPIVSNNPSPSFPPLSILPLDEDDIDQPKKAFAKRLREDRDKENKPNFSDGVKRRRRENEGLKPSFVSSLTCEETLEEGKVRNR